MIQNLQIYQHDLTKLYDQPEDFFMFGYLVGSRLMKKNDQVYNQFMRLNEMRKEKMISFEEKKDILEQAIDGSNSMKDIEIQLDLLIQQITNNKMYSELACCFICSQMIQSKTEQMKTSCCKVSIHGICFLNKVAKQIWGRERLVCFNCQESNIDDALQTAKFCDSQQQSQDHISQIQNDQQYRTREEAQNINQNSSHTKIQDGVYSHNPSNLIQQQFFAPSYKNTRVNPCLSNDSTSSKQQYLQNDSIRNQNQIAHEIYNQRNPIPNWSNQKNMYLEGQSKYASSMQPTTTMYNRDNQRQNNYDQNQKPQANTCKKPQRNTICAKQFQTNYKQ